MDVDDSEDDERDQHNDDAMDVDADDDEERDDSKDDEKDQRDDDSDDEESLPMYPPELLGTESDRRLLMVIMLNACAVSQMFAKDSHEEHISSKSILYAGYCDLAERGCLIGRSEDAVQLVRICVLHLLTFPLVRSRWLEIRLRTQTVIPKSFRNWTPNDSDDNNEAQTRRDGVVMLGPPIEKCLKCDNDLVTKNRMSPKDCFTLDGIVTVSGISYICNMCSNHNENGTVVYHYDCYLWRGQKHYYGGTVGGENYVFLLALHM